MEKYKLSFPLYGIDGILLLQQGESITLEKIIMLFKNNIISAESYLASISDCLKTTNKNSPTSEIEICNEYIHNIRAVCLPFVDNYISEKVEEIITATISNPSNIVIPKWLSILHRKDDCTLGHALRVAIIASAIAVRLNMPSDQIKLIVQGALMHDLGKIFCMDIVKLNRALTDEEFEIIKKHTEHGANMCKSMNFEDTIVNICKYHHERLDGSGYYAMTEWPSFLEVQIVGLADTLDALLSKRSYKEALEAKKVFDILEEESKHSIKYASKLLSLAKKILVCPN